MCSLRYRRSIPLFLKRRHKVTRIALVTQNYLSSIPCGILHRSKSIFPLAGKGIFLVRSFIVSFVSWIKETKEKQQQQKNRNPCTDARSLSYWELYGELGHFKVHVWHTFCFMRPSPVQPWIVFRLYSDSAAKNRKSYSVAYEWPRQNF